MREGSRPGCCERGDAVLREHDNSQLADPGWRHVRINVQSPNLACSGSERVRFCPYCGSAFRLTPLIHYKPEAGPITACGIDMGALTTPPCIGHARKVENVSCPECMEVCDAR